MTKWARKNEDGKIIEIIDFDPSGKFHESIIWEQVADSVSINDTNDLDPDNNPDTLKVREESLARLEPGQEL